SYDSARLLEGMVLHEIGCFEEALGALDGLVVPWAGSGTRTVAALSRIGLGDVSGARALLLEVRAAGHPFDEGVILAALGESEAAFEALGRARFDGLAFAESYWPTVALRYLFGRVWKGLRADPRHAALARRMDESWGLERIDWLSERGLVTPPPDREVGLAPITSRPGALERFLAERDEA
ncbi:MAG: hypothetical protein LC667_05200, partial [Thioalkalivibrio sp.]|nr:hypothetical protein [Thioalkalivibrio sp.]